MKKVISLAVALVLCLSIFAGCGAMEVNLADLMDDEFRVQRRCNKV